MGKAGRSALTVVVVTFAAALLTGCGLTQPEARATPSPTGPKTNGLEKLGVAKILERAETASAEADTVHVVGKTQDDGALVELDIRIKKDAGGVGHIVTDGLRMDVIRMDTVLYFKGDKRFWKEVSGDAQVAAMLAGKWVKTSTKDKDMADLGAVVDSENLLSDSLEYTGGLPRKGKPETLDGQLVLPLVDRDGQKAYIALTGEPRLLKLTEKSGFATTFTYDETVELKAPPKKQIFDLEKFTG